MRMSKDVERNGQQQRRTSLESYPIIDLRLKNLLMYFG